MYLLLFITNRINLVEGVCEQVDANKQTNQDEDDNGHTGNPDDQILFCFWLAWTCLVSGITKNYFK